MHQFHIHPRYSHLFKTTFVLSSYLRQLIRVVVLYVFRPKFSMHSLLLFRACYVQHSPHSISFGYPKNILWRMKIMKFFLSQFLLLCYYFLSVILNILLSIVLSNFRCLRSFPNLAVHVSHSQKLWRNLVLYILNSPFRDSYRNTKNY